jgi:hypothetical protein
MSGKYVMLVHGLIPIRHHDLASVDFIVTIEIDRCLSGTPASKVFPGPDIRMRPIHIEVRQTN